MYINNLDKEQLIKVIEELGHKSFRGVQLFRWLHKQKLTDFDNMSNIPKELKNEIIANFELDQIELEKKMTSREDSTRKYLFKLNDGNIIESVYLSYDYGNSACISSQIGCNMGCVFCASTKGGKLRDLRSSEMLQQVYMIEKDIGAMINSIVIMGSGEPFDNYENLKSFITIVTDPEGKGLSKRKITVSTSGLINNIYRSADDELGFNLAISLHAVFEDKRKKIIPNAKQHRIHDIVEACDYYTKKTGRRVTYEYILIDGFNDTMDDLIELTNLLKGHNCHVNLIPLNPIEEYGGKAPSQEKIDQFYKTLERNQINTTIRRELGKDINAACGQLRNQHIKKQG
jgi:23S rRNA (adenine2503-C2)-methyltransferase